MTNSLFFPWIRIKLWFCATVVQGLACWFFKTGLVRSTLSEALTFKLSRLIFQLLILWVSKEKSLKGEEVLTCLIWCPHVAKTLVGSWWKFVGEKFLEKTGQTEDVYKSHSEVTYEDTLTEREKERESDNHKVHRTTGHKQKNIQHTHTQAQNHTSPHAQKQKRHKTYI